MDRLKLIKGIVFILTFLLVFGSLLALGSLFRKTRSAPLPKSFNLAQPAGSSIEKMIANDGRLYILVKDGGQSDRIIIFDSREGQKTTTLNIN